MSLLAVQAVAQLKWTPSKSITSIGIGLSMRMSTSVTSTSYSKVDTNDTVHSANVKVEMSKRGAQTLAAHMSPMSLITTCLPFFFTRFCKYLGKYFTSSLNTLVNTLLAW